MEWLLRRSFRPRGWLLIAAGLLALLFAQLLGRRDLLFAAVFLFTVPLAASVGLRFFIPNFTVRRRFSPAFVQVGTPAQVTLEVHGSIPGGARATIREQLPAHLIDVPHFEYPHPVAPRSLLSRYSYTLHPSRRGVLTIGPLTASFDDPFAVALLQRELDEATSLTVAPAAIELPLISLSSGHGQDGFRMTRQRSNPSNDDVMTREYQHGDPVRRVHWPATARAGKLMVRSEESVATPQATLILDQRFEAYGGAAPTDRSKDSLLSSPSFEWAVTAAVSIATHLLELNYCLRVLDDQGHPGFENSQSAQEPGREDFSGESGTLAVAQSLAALELRKRTTYPAASGTATSSPVAVSEALANKLFQARRRGPVVALTGMLEIADAALLASTVEASENSFALIVCQEPALAEEAVEILRQAGWQAVAFTPETPLRHAWNELDARTPLGTSGRGSHG